MEEDSWYRLREPEKTDSPALLIYPARIAHNIAEMIRIAGKPERLVPHVKTHKMAAVVRMQLHAGIRRFKCATIAEAEMLAEAGAAEVLLAYQLNRTKAERFLELVKTFPDTRFASLVDNPGSADMLDMLYAAAGIPGGIFIDVDNGMHRTGFPADGPLADFYRGVATLPHLTLLGLHVYDGHIRDHNFAARRDHCIEAFRPVEAARETLEAEGFSPEIIAGGSPTFPIHAEDSRRSLSPGTPLLWDGGYAEQLAEQPFLQAAVLLTRIISRNQPGQITADLGHKSVAAENPIDRRVSFLNLSSYQVSSQSEEHLVIKVPETERTRLSVGDALYGVPYHICPSVALYEEAQVVENGEVVDRWPVDARSKRVRF